MNVRQEFCPQLKLLAKPKRTFPGREISNGTENKQRLFKVISERQKYSKSHELHK